MALDPGAAIAVRKVNLQVNSGITSPEPLSFTHFGLCTRLGPNDY